jgi:hypothetical protein
MQLELDPKPGQRLWLISREAAPGWYRMHETYSQYKEAVSKNFKVLEHSKLAMIDIYQVTPL